MTIENISCSLVLNVLLSTMASIFTAQVQNILLVYYVCRVHIKVLNRICICTGLAPFLVKKKNIQKKKKKNIQKKKKKKHTKKKQKKTEHSLICILAEIPYHLDHGKRRTNEYPGLVKEPVIKSVFI